VKKDLLKTLPAELIAEVCLFPFSFSSRQTDLSLFVGPLLLPLWRPPQPVLDVEDLQPSPQLEVVRVDLAEQPFSLQLARSSGRRRVLGISLRAPHLWEG
jgi:hypothetical protein